MPGKIVVKIIAARNLPIMDRSSELTDAFVEVRFGDDLYDKTLVCKKSLDPEWNARFKFEVEEDEIQEEPLLIRVLDHDTYSAHDSIGKVYIDLKPLLHKDGPSSICGWLPIYDTMHGIRGEIHVQAKIELFEDFNEYRKSSCGVQFFSSSKIPDGYVLQSFCGFVEELVLNEDPEYQWIDKIRTPRTSNEARQKLFLQLSGEVQRRIGLKVLDMGANCVLGYLQYFDLEGEYGIVVRGIGTAAFIIKQTNLSPSILHHQLSLSPQALMNAAKENNFAESLNLKLKRPSPSRTVATAATGTPLQSIANTTTSPPPVIHPLHRGYSDSNLITHQHHQPLPQAPSTQAPPNAPLPVQHQQSVQQAETSQQQQQKQSILEKYEYPFLTLQQYPLGFIKSLCGIVCARSVKLHSTTAQQQQTSENNFGNNIRDKWLIELRNEIRTQMKSLDCNIVLGYTETKSICEDVCILSAMGTAACVDETFFQHYETHMKTDEYLRLFDEPSVKNCSICHLITTHLTADYDTPNNTNQDEKVQQQQLQQQQPLDDVKQSQQLDDTEHDLCSVCSNAYVPDVLFLTIQPIPELQTNGKGCLLKALVSRPRKKCSGEMSAKIISDCLPFMEYELHKQLFNKLKLNGMNTLYGLRIQISIGENLIIFLAEATACYTTSLPKPKLPKLVLNTAKSLHLSHSITSNQQQRELDELTKLLNERMLRNIAHYKTAYPSSVQQTYTNLNGNFLKNNNGLSLNGSNGQNVDVYEKPTQSPDEIKEYLNDIIKIDLDDISEKENIIQVLNTLYKPHRGFQMSNSEYIPGIPYTKLLHNIQMFTRIFRCETSLVQLHTKELNEILDRILNSLKYKFRNYINCALYNISFDISLYDDDHAMIIMNGTVIKLKTEVKGDALAKSSVRHTIQQQHQFKSNNVELTSLSYIPNAYIESYLGHINLFLIRETTSIKDYSGLNGFVHCFLLECMSLARAHVLSLGGNALVSYKMTECILLDNPHKNQAQCLINIAGDAVHAIRFTN